MAYPQFHCPVCQHVLPEIGDVIRCPSCQQRYGVWHGLPELIAKQHLDSFKQTERHFHDELATSVRRGRIAGRMSDFHRHFKQPMFDLPGHAAILEVACGTRADGIELALAGKDVTCLDISLDAVQEGQRLAQQNSAGRIRFLVADGEHLPFADCSFDATFIAASFHHFPNQLAALNEMKRVTKHGGYVIWGVEPAAWPYQTVFRLLRPVKNYIRKHRVRRHDSIADDSTTGYTQKDIRVLFQQAGLVILEIKPVKFLSEFYDSGTRLIGRVIRRDLRPWSTLDHVLSRIDTLLEQVPLLNRLFWHWNVIARVPKPV
ncbi:MAG: class I SAM-dependent methyltransferase [Candidatus Kerfeldbacteria bacterium]|nr:class I SAM-dependent methyltransferase [Candidatus Kerfeldbacteria bacterium]